MPAQNQHKAAADDSNETVAAKAEANHYFRLLTSLVARWPLSCREALIAQAYSEHKFLRDDPKALDLSKLRSRRRNLLKHLTSLIPTYRVQIRPNETRLVELQKPISICPGMPSLVLISCANQTGKAFAVRATADFNAPTNARLTTIPPNREVLLSYTVHVKELDRSPESRNLQLECSDGESRLLVSIPIQLVKPARLQLRLTNEARPLSGEDVAGRITVQCSDGICRHGGRFGERATFTDKPIIYPPVGTWQKLPFFYSDQFVQIEVPPGSTNVTFERGFEHRRENVDLELKSGETLKVERSCPRMIEMSAVGWISGDTHVHWVTNAWNVDEPLDLLSMAQRAEDLKVANNLTLLQRYANQAFVKPSQAPMGPILKYSDGRYHMQMGEEYRNEDLYGHLCLLNIDWLVQPIGTGKIIAGPDSLDYPINRTAIEACRIQGGISIEAHGTGGNKDVPVNVIHRLSDSLDQMEPEMYYRLLECGFQIPLTNGSDHPARTLGIARAYVKVEGEFSYDRWIEGIRKGKTFTTSGPLLFLKVNDAGIGDVIRTDPGEELHITAKVISRDPIGTLQIVSNGDVLYSHDTNDTHFETELTIPAEESRWIVARCSNRKDGRADFGFGNYNVITGPGIAHTSPVYVQVDGMPRFDSLASEYWQERMRIHADDIRTRGRFANDAQHQEAVRYIEQGIKMFRDLENQVRLARSGDETFKQLKGRLTNVVRRFGASDFASHTLETIENTTSYPELCEALEPVTPFTLLAKPESVLNFVANTKRIKLRQGRPQRFLVAIENQSRATGPLRIEVFDLASETPRVAEWCRAEVIDSPFTSAFLTGATTEYKVVEFVANEDGQRKVRLIAGIGKKSEPIGMSTIGTIEINVAPRRRSNSAPVAK